MLGHGSFVISDTSILLTQATSGGEYLMVDIATMPAPTSIKAALKTHKTPLPSGGACISSQRSRPRPSGKHGLGELIDLQSLFGHLGILQEVQRHPHQVPLNRLELGAHVLGRQEPIVDVPSLDAFGWEECVVFLKGCNCEKRKSQ